MKKRLLFLCIFFTKVTVPWAQSPAEIDAIFSKPYIDIDEWRDSPKRHHYVHGGFEGTTTRFSFYFPAKEAYKGHFFQYITPVPDNERLSQGATGEEDKISFSILNGAYFVETNGGGITDPGAGFGKDALIIAYKANAASAQFSKIKAAEFYGSHRTFGYCFGGSGGAYRTIGAIENTQVWDGAVPYVVGSPMAIPNVFSVRMHAMRILKDKFPQIVDAVDVGGSGDMYAGLNQEEKKALMEVTRMGFPPKSWFAYETMGIHGFAALYQGVVMADGKYFDDFWTKEGYYGTKPTESLLNARIQQKATIKARISAEEAEKLNLGHWNLAGQARGTAESAWQKTLENGEKVPVSFRLSETLKKVDFLGGDLKILSGKAKGKQLFITSIKDDKVIFGGADTQILNDIEIGDEVILDNSNFLAAQTYHRHQVPGADYTVWDQFKNQDGKPLYPQRPMQLGPLFTRAASGTLPSGKFQGKMILLESLYDREAFPWQADWYYQKVKANLGDKTDDNFRVYMTDHALHGDNTNQEYPTRTVSYLGVLQQALLDLSNWVENGIAPPTSTVYTIEDGQVIVPDNAMARKGIQPTISLKVNGKERVDIQKGTSVTFKATIVVPPNSGSLIAAEWDFDGNGTFPISSKVRKGNSVTLKAKHIFNTSGTFFPTLRVASQRDGDSEKVYTRIQNLERVRVVVK